MTTATGYGIERAHQTSDDCRAKACLKERIAGRKLGGHDRVVWETTDPDGRRVVLTFERWRHIVDKHGDLVRHRRAVLEAVAQPDERIPGRKRDEEWFYGSDARTNRWIRVVVHYEGDRGHIVTAFPRRLIP